MERRKFLKYFSCGCCGLFVSSCSSVPITDRKQLTFIPESMLNKQASQLYYKVKQKSKLIPNNDERVENVKIVGKNIENAVSNYFKINNLSDPTTGFDWEYIVIDNDKVKNAWCMPGGKIAVYTGILKITKNLNGLSAVMGHEIAHAVAKHSVERASRSVLLNIGTSIADLASGGAISRTSRAVGVDVAGMLRHLGIDNPFGRKQEKEADYLGLIFSSLAGYDIRETTKLWERMKKSNKGKEPPEWMSTHPSTDKRIVSLNEWIPEIILKYPPLKQT